MRLAGDGKKGARNAKSPTWRNAGMFFSGRLALSLLFVVPKHPRIMCGCIQTKHVCCRAAHGDHFRDFWRARTTGSCVQICKTSAVFSSHLFPGTVFRPWSGTAHATQFCLRLIRPGMVRWRESGRPPQRRSCFGSCARANDQSTRQRARAGHPLARGRTIARCVPLARLALHSANTCVEETIAFNTFALRAWLIPFAR